MEKIEKMHLMDKMIRELEDVHNSQTSLLKKIAQLEADNINLSNTILEKELPNMYGKIEEAVAEANKTTEAFKMARDQFVATNKLEEVLPE